MSAAPTPFPALTILAGDKPGVDRCSRCAGELGRRVMVLVWNNAEFWYCEHCQPDASKEATR
jgi:hypothetical protein